MAADVALNGKEKIKALMELAKARPQEESKHPDKERPQHAADS